MASYYTTYVCIRLSHLFPLITFVLNMMYLQIIYQCENLWISRNDKAKSFNWPINKQDMASQKNPIYFQWSIISVLTNYLQLLLYISHEQSDLYMLVTTKALLVAITRQRWTWHSLIAYSISAQWYNTAKHC